MNEATFQMLARRAKLLTGDYGAGYLRGLRRAHHGAHFGTADEHALWSRLGLNGDIRDELGRGYRDGLAGANAAPRIGRPTVAESSAAPVRTMRLSDGHWAELQARGGVAALRDWLSSSLPRRSPPRA
jgi:hypothetical protein